MDVTKQRVLHTVREWEIKIPYKGTQEWRELVQLLMHRSDLSDDWWPEELITNSLVAEAELTGNHEFGYETFVDGKLVKKVLATVTYAAARTETVFDPAHYHWALEATELELEHNQILAAARALERANDIENPDERYKAVEQITELLQDSLRNIGDI